MCAGNLRDELKWVVRCSDVDACGNPCKPLCLFTTVGKTVLGQRQDGRYGKRVDSVHNVQRLQREIVTG